MKGPQAAASLVGQRQGKKGTPEVKKNRRRGIPSGTGKTLVPKGAGEAPEKKLRDPEEERTQAIKVTEIG